MKKAFDLERVLTELAENDKAALGQLYNYYYPRLFNFSRSFLKLHEGIDDILQEVFIKIWRNRKNIYTPNTFNSYVFIITRNLLLNELRSRINNKKVKELIAQQTIAIEFSFEQSEYSDLKEKFEEAINQLPVRQKEVFLLSRIEGLSHKEIAKKLAITSKTVEYHIARATLFLKERLRNFDLVSILLVYIFV